MIIRRKQKSNHNEDPVPVTPLEDIQEDENSKSIAGEGATQQGQHEPQPTSSSPKDHWQGGYSQWRDEPESESSWKHWQWPPADWRPQPWHKAYYDQNSRYYKYNNYNWSHNDRNEQANQSTTTGSPQTTTEPSQSPTTPAADTPGTLSKASTMEVETVTAQLARARTAEQTEFMQKLDAAANSEPKPSAAQSQQEQKQQPPAAPEEESTRLERRKAAAHARYMRYYRNIRSSSPS